MKKICAWCNKVLDEGENVHLITVSHGICVDCYAKLYCKIKEDLSARDLESIKKKLDSGTSI